MRRVPVRAERGRWQAGGWIRDAPTQAGTRATEEGPDTTHVIRRDFPRGRDRFVDAQKD